MNFLKKQKIMDDTPKNIANLYKDMILARSPQDRLRMVSSMFDSAKKLAAAGILSEKPNLSPAELRASLFMRFYGSDFSTEECKIIVARYLNPAEVNSN